MKASYMLVATLVMLLPVRSPAQDYKIIKLEQDVRKLEQQVRELSRQVTELRSRTGVPPEPIPAAERDETVRVPPPLWLQATRWQGLRIGMNEEQVLAALGPPTTTRLAADGGNRILFYVLELAAGSFLGGRVELRDGRVVEIEPPGLK